MNDPLDARQHNDLGVSYEQRREYDLALREFTRAVELDGNWVQPLVNRGNVHALSEAWDEAASDYRQALQLAPDHAEAMNNLAWVLLKAGKASEGLGWAEKAVNRAPDNPQFWDTLAAHYQALGDPPNAATAARQGLRLNPSPELREALEDYLSVSR